MSLITKADIPSLWTENRVKSNEKKPADHDSKKNEGSDADGTDCSGRVMKYLNAVAAEQKQYRVCSRTASAIGWPTLSRWRIFLCQTAKTNNIANSQRIRGSSIPLQSYAAMIFQTHLPSSRSIRWLT